MYKILIDGELFCDSRIDDLAIIDPVVKLRANDAGSLTFSVAPTHPKINLIKRRTSVFSVYRDTETEPIFQGICISDNTDFLKRKKVVCEGELTYFNDSIQRQAKYQNMNVRQLLETYINVHNQQVDDFKRFEVGQVTVEGNIYCFTNMNSTMRELKEDLIDDYGGYFRIRHENGKNILDYLADSPRTSTQQIELGKNLLDYSSNIDSSDIATVVIPLGERLDTQAVEGLEAYLDIKSVNGGKDYLESANAIASLGRVTKVVHFDDVTIASNLKSKGLQYLQEAQFEDVYLDINAVDFGMVSDRFDKFELLDTIRVVSPTHGMDRNFMLTELTINLNNPANNKITLGKNTKLTLSERSVKSYSKLESVPTADAMQNAINNATALITGNKGGHVVIHKDDKGEPFEILIMDTEDITTARHVWRWNQNGFGYSSTGYAGPYGTAITMDGNIIADFIRGGIIQGIEIKSTGSVTRYAQDYTRNDWVRAGEIAFGGITPTDEELEKYDINSDGIINLSDVVAIYNFIQGTSSSKVIDTSVTINGSGKKSIVKTHGVDIGADYVNTKNAIVNGTLRLNSGTNHYTQVYDPTYQQTYDGKTYTGGYRYVVGDGIYTNISRMKIINGLVCEVTGNFTPLV